MALTERELAEAAGQSVNPDHVFLRAAADHLADQLRALEDGAKGAAAKVEKATADLAAAKVGLREAKAALSDAKAELRMAEQMADAAERTYRDQEAGDGLTGAGTAGAEDASVHVAERG